MTSMNQPNQPNQPNQRNSLNRLSPVTPVIRRLGTLFLSGLLLLSLLTGCTTRPKDVYRNPRPVVRTEAVSLKLGLVPSVDALPFWVAEAEGFLSSLNVDLELVAYSTAAARDQALAKGEVDGALVDLLSAIAAVGAKQPLKIVSLVKGANPQEGTVGLVTGKDSGIRDLNDLRGQTVAVTRESQLEYALERLLQQSGLPVTALSLTEMTSDASRHDAVLAGEVKAAVLSEPYLSFAVNRGAKLLVSEVTAGQSYSQSVLLFREEVLKQKESAVKDLLRAQNWAVAAVRANADAYMDLLAEKSGIPIFVKVVYHEGFALPVAQLPRQDAVDDLVQWMQQRKLITGRVSFDSLVTKKLLPSS